MMWYVYSESRSGRQECCGIYDTREQAIERITLLYAMDRNSCASKGEYYYFMKAH